MAKEKRLIIDVDKVIASYNKNNPEGKKMGRVELAKIMGLSPQVFANWKTERVPTNKMVYHLEKLAKIGQCEMSYFIVDVDASQKEMKNHFLEIKKTTNWTATLYKTNEYETEKEIVGSVDAENYPDLIVEIGNKNWIDIVNKSK